MGALHDMEHPPRTDAHARFGTLAQFRLRVAEGDLAGAGAALAAAEAVWPEHEAVSEAVDVYALVTGDEGAGMRGEDVAAKAGGTTDAASAKAAGEAGRLAVYPNPSAGRATVALTTAERTEVRLVVYGALGREVAVLADGPFEASTHEVIFDGAGLPSGTYLVRMTVDGGFIQTQRVTVVR